MVFALRIEEWHEFMVYASRPQRMNRREWIANSRMLPTTTTPDVHMWALPHSPLERKVYVYDKYFVNTTIRFLKQYRLDPMA